MSNMEMRNLKFLADNAQKQGMVVLCNMGDVLGEKYEKCTDALVEKDSGKAERHQKTPEQIANIALDEGGIHPDRAVEFLELALTEDTSRARSLVHPNFKRTKPTMSLEYARTLMERGDFPFVAVPLNQARLYMGKYGRAPNASVVQARRDCGIREWTPQLHSESIAPSKGQKRAQA